MKYKKVFDEMVKEEIASAKNPNYIITYEVMWNRLKQKIQFDKIL